MGAEYVQLGLRNSGPGEWVASARAEHSPVGPQAVKRGRREGTKGQSAQGLWRPEHAERPSTARETHLKHPPV